MQILLVSGQNNIRSALRLLIKHHHPDWMIQEAASVKQMLINLRQSCPEILILDWHLATGSQNGGNAEEHWKTVLNQIQHCCHQPCIIILDTDPETRLSAIRAGAHAFICKTDPPETILVTIHEWMNTQSSEAKEEPHARKSE
ncbi:MAG TPA: hypothetical protein VHO48_13960 [Anaerolineaceae bacterium]|nr:hypothetical protein [Anaerolineaceae bacterium]